MGKFVMIATLLGLATLNQHLATTDALYYPFKLIHNASHTISLTPEDWAAEFRCNLNAISEQYNPNQTLPIDCYRDENSWIYKHIDELHEGFKLLVKQHSFDERSTDSIYLANGHTGLDFHHYIFNSGDSEHDLANQELVAGSRVNNELCKDHLRQMLALVVELGQKVERNRQRSDDFERLDERHFRLARILDSFGRYQSGQLEGRYHSFGMYEQCIGTAMKLGDDYTQLVESRYCWARLKLDQHLSRPLKEHHSILDVNFGDFKFHLAVCLPATCHSKSFTNDQENLHLLQGIINTQYKMPRLIYLNESLPLDSVFCLVDQDSPMARIPTGGWIFIGFISSWFMLCVFATYKRRNKHNLMLDDLRAVAGSPARRRKDFWSHMDLFESWCEFLGERDLGRLRGAQVNLDPLNFIKFFCTTTVVLAHASLLSGPLALSQIRVQAFMETQRFESLSLFGFVLIDTFFVISGLVVTYINLKRMAGAERGERLKLGVSGQLQMPATMTNNKKPTNFEREYSLLGLSFYKSWLTLSLGRYLRLVPLFFLVFWFKKTIYVHLPGGGGPMWDYGLNKNTNIGGCLQETWLVPFTPLSAFLPLAQQCLPQTWSISNDLFYALIIPPIVVLLWKWPRTAVTLALLVLTSGLYLGSAAYFALDLRYRFEMEQIRNHSVIILFQVASYIYTIPWYRAPAIVVGVMAGYVLFNYDRREAARLELLSANNQVDGHGDRVQSRDHHWPWCFRHLATKFALGFVAFTIVACLLTPDLRKSSTQNVKDTMPYFMLLLHHPLWSLSNAAIFLRMISDWRERFTMRLLASKFFGSASRLCYPILLLHWDLLMYDLQSETQALDFSRWNYFRSMAMAYIYCTLLGIFVHVAFENPLDKLTKTYILRV